LYTFTAGCLLGAGCVYVAYKYQSDVCRSLYHKIKRGSFVPILDELDFIDKHRARRAAVADPGFYALYSSWIGGIVTEPALMQVPLDDHMVHRGHAVFDTASLVDGRIYRMEPHLDRLLYSAAKARIKLPFSRERMREVIEQTCSASGKRTASIRFWLSVGPGDFGFLPDGCIESCFYVLVFGGIPIDKDLELKGINEFTVTGVPMKPPALATMKSNNYLLNCLTAMESKDKGGKFGILVDGDGKIAESCVLNIAFVNHNDKLITPPFKHILAGVTIRKVLELGQKMVHQGKLRGVEQRDIKVDEARKAKEMFLLGGDTHLIPVVSWDNIPVGAGTVGPVFKYLLSALENDKHLGFADHQVVRYVH